jgi:hypothetical protein
MRILQTNETISLNFISDTESPAVLFGSLSKLFDSIIKVQQELVVRAEPLLRVEFLLSNVRSGSVFADYLKKIIIPEKDDVLTPPNVQGDVLKYSSSSQSAMLDVLQPQNGKIIKNEEIHEIASKIVSCAGSSGVRQNVNFKMPNVLVIANTAKSFEEATSLLDKRDSFIFHADQKQHEIKKFILILICQNSSAN